VAVVLVGRVVVVAVVVVVRPGRSGPPGMVRSGIDHGGPPG
jgi:hypothetical protein